MRPAQALLVRVALVLTALTLTSCDFLRGYAQGHSTNLQHYETADLPAVQMGAARFVFDDFGALNTDTLATHALPWKLVAAALVTQRFPNEPATEQNLRALLRGFGFISAERIGNWPIGTPPQFRAPLGITTGRMQRDIPRIDLEVANLSCASCHAGVTYDANGNPLPVAWLGMPNTSLDLDAYFDAVDAALRGAAPERERQRVTLAVKQLFPDVGKRELASLAKYAWPRLVERLARGEPHVRDGGPGRANALATLARQLHLAADPRRATAAVSIPQIGDQVLRWAVLADGIATRRSEPRFESRSWDAAAPSRRTAEIVTTFSAPVLGLHPDKATDAVEPIAEVLEFFVHYQPPRFPGTIDEAAATRGAVIYARCTECHGEYVERDDHLGLRNFPNRLSPLAEIGTDPMRAGAVDDSFATAVESTLLGITIDAQPTGGYVAPNLAGLWATAPYLHNGSVPTLHALMTPPERPAKFWVGGHKLDFVKIGIAGAANAAGEYAYAADYLPWSTPRLFDTALPGQSNRGHEHEFDGLTEADKSDLIEFLKQL